MGGCSTHKIYGFLFDSKNEGGAVIMNNDSVLVVSRLKAGGRG